MPGVRKRENRENQFYNVGEQGRKTGITLEDRGVRDEYGMEPVSGIFSSPEKSPEKRSGMETVTESESMDIQESSIPDLTPGHILRNQRSSLPPPRSRSPIKTSLGATPRRSVGPLSRPAHKSPTPDLPDVGSAVNRRLDFDQEESSLQETPALSGSGARRNIARRDIYDLEQSPSLVAVAQEEVSVTEEVSANDVSMNEVSEMITGVAEESFAGAVGEDTSAGADVPDESAQEEESRVEEEPIKQPLRRGRKRKSDALEPTADKESPVVQKKTRAESKQAATTEKEEAPVEQPAKRPRGRPKRVSEIVEEQLESADASMDESAQTADSPVPAQPKRRGRPPKAASMNSPVQAEESPAPAQPKRRGRPPKDKVDAPPSRPGQDEEEATAKTRTKQTKSKASESAPSDEATEEPTFKKPKAVGRPKGKATEKAAKAPEPAPGRLVDALGKPLSKDDIEQMSTTSAGSRYNRGRALSYFRELGAEEFGRISRTGRRNIPPINFWLNEHAQYDRDGNLVRVVQNEAVDEPPRKRGPKSKGKKKAASAEEDEEEELEDWEVNDGVFVGPYLDFDISTETTSEEQLESTLAWAAKGIQPQQVPNAQFKFTKLGSAGSGFFSWGCLELDADDIKRTKNSRRMHMSFHVTKGAVEVNVNNNLFTVHKGGVWQVPRGNNYSIRNVAKGQSRIFFAQAFESVIREEDED